jgi:hypothetical protein
MKIARFAGRQRPVRGRRRGLFLQGLSGVQSVERRSAAWPTSSSWPHRASKVIGIGPNFGHH